MTPQRREYFRKLRAKNHEAYLEYQRDSWVLKKESRVAQRREHRQAERARKKKHREYMREYRSKANETRT